MNAYGFRARDASSLKTELQAVTRDHAAINCCVLFASVKTNLASLLPVLREFPLRVFGASSGGEILTKDDAPAVARSTVAGLALEMPESHFDIQAFDTSELSSFEAGREIGLRLRDSFERPAIFLMASGLETDGDALIRGIKKTFPRAVPVFGALAADDLDFKQTFVFSESDVYSSGVVICIVDTDRIEVGGIATHGWREIGDSKIVTRAEGNRVYEIDGKPALQFYREYVGIEGKKDLSTALEFPLQVRRKRGASVLRAVIGINDDGSLHFNGRVPERSAVHLSSPPGPAVIDNTVQDLEEYHRDFPNADAGILFHCAVRHHALGDRVEREILRAGRLWNISITGVFSYGEIGPSGGVSCDFHAATYSLFLMRDRLSPAGQGVPDAGPEEIALTGREMSVRRLNLFQRRLESIHANGKAKRGHIAELLADFREISGDFKEAISRVDSLTEHHFTKSVLLTKTSEDLRKKIESIEALNVSLEETYRLVRQERNKADHLLRNILPEQIAIRMKQGERHIAEKKSGVTVLFADIVGFTAFARGRSPEEVVDFLNVIFTGMDRLAEKHGLEKIKTIGDCYMAASMQIGAVNNSAVPVADFALELAGILPRLSARAGLRESIRLRMGLHAGEVVAGVIGEKRFIYDLWGDTVNTASRMESHGEPGKIHCTGIVFELLMDRYIFTERGSVDIKGQSAMETYFLEGKKKTK